MVILNSWATIILKKWIISVKLKYSCLIRDIIATNLVNSRPHLGQSLGFFSLRWFCYSWSPEAPTPAPPAPSPTPEAPASSIAASPAPPALQQLILLLLELSSFRFKSIPFLFLLYHPLRAKTRLLKLMLLSIRRCRNTHTGLYIHWKTSIQTYNTTFKLPYKATHSLT